MTDPDEEASRWDEEVTLLWHKLHGQVRRHVINLGAVPETAEEIVSDAFLAARRKWPVVRGYERPEAFIYKVATVLHRRSHLHESQRREQLVSDPPETSAVLDDARFGVVTAVDMRRALQSLPRRCREVLLLRYAEDFCVAQTAQILGISEGAVKRYASDGKARLAALLTSYENTGEGSR